MALFNEGDCVPEVTLPMISPFSVTISCPVLGIPRSINSKPTNLFLIPFSFCWKINFIHLDDCIELIKRCIQFFQNGSIYNGVSPYHPTRIDYYTEMAKKAAVPLPPFRKQRGIIRTISSQKAEKNLGIRFVVENLLTLN